MWLKVTGGRRVNTSMVKLIAPGIMADLVGPRLYPTLDVEVEFIKKMYYNEKIAGECIAEDDGYHAPKTFTIRIDRDVDFGTDKHGLERFIAHELTHVKQYAKGELRDLVREPGKSWKTHRYYDDNVGLYDAPWEVEAYQNEKQLIDNWLKQATPKQLRKYEELYRKQ